METYMRIRNTTGPYFPLDGKASRKRFMIGRHAPAQDFILLAKNKAKRRVGPKKLTCTIEPCNPSTHYKYIIGIHYPLF